VLVSVINGYTVFLRQQDYCFVARVILQKSESLPGK
jgi:hypothetical protein